MIEPETYAARLSNHAAALLGTSQRATALALLQRAASLSTQPGITTNLAIAHMTFGDYAESSRLLHGLVTANPTDLASWHAYGVLGLVAGEPEEAITSFQRCLQLDPSTPTHRFDHSLALMQAGRWEAGWAAYEGRRNYKPERLFPGLPRWDGSPGKSVYVWAEQGLGDTFQFARYLPRLREISKRVVLAIPPSLFTLFEGYKEVVDLLVFNAEVADIECEVALMSLPYHLGQTPDRWPLDPGLLAKGLAPLPLTRDFKVGLCWACGPASHHHAERSVPFSSLVRVLENSTASFYSLQVGAAAQDISANAAQLVVTDLSPGLTDDWAQTASAIKAMDLVVSTDTSVAHLAAALNKPTIMLLARRDWWRWGNSAAKTPWYPTMTIVRQARPFCWEAEIKQVSALIGQAAQERSAKCLAA